MSKFNELEIVEKYNNGMNTVELASEYNTYNTTIRRILLRNKVPLKSISDRLRFVQNNPFINNTPVADYFLGLLIADGCISKNTITLGLKEEDMYMLEAFALFCSPKLKVNKYFHSTHKKYQYQVSFRNKEIGNWLKTKANFVNKSLECVLFSNLNPSILRGISDGDGCFHIDKSNSLRWDLANGSRDFCLQIMDFLTLYNIKSTLKYNHCWHVLVYKDSYKLGQLLYSTSGPFLLRKRNIWAGYSGRSRKINRLNSGNLSEQQS